MGDGDVKPPPLPKDTPKEMVDFVECKTDSVKLKGGAQTWIGTISLGDFSISPDVTFEKGEKDGTVNVVVGKGGFGLSLPVSVGSDGSLSVDTSGLPEGKIKDNIDGWVKKFNDNMKAKKKKLGGMTLKDGDVTLTKTSLVAVAPGGGVKEVPGMPARTGTGGLLTGITTSVRRASPVRKVGAGAAVALGVGFGVGFAGYGNSTAVASTTVFSGSPTSPTAGAPSPTVTAAPSPPVPQPVSIVGGSVCIVGQGATSLIDITVYTQSTVTGVWGGMIVGPAASPSAGISASATISGGTGEFPFTITQFGTYSGLTVTDATGAPVGLGPLGGLFPFTVSSDNQPCEQAGPQSPAAPAPAPASAPASSSASGGAVGGGISSAGGQAPTDVPQSSAPSGTTTTTTTTSTSTDPWSLLAIPGGFVVAGGLLIAGSTPSIAGTPAVAGGGHVEHSDMWDDQIDETGPPGGGPREPGGGPPQGGSAPPTMTLDTEEEKTVPVTGDSSPPEDEVM